MKNVFSMKTMSVAIVACVALLASCSKTNDNPLGSTDSQNVNSESVSATATDESADMASSVVGGVSDTKLNTGSRLTGDHAKINGILFDSRLYGAQVTITPYDSSTIDRPTGVITIDFGTGVTVNGITRKGIINIVYWGRRWVVNSYRKLTYSDYYRNGVNVDGTFKITNTSSDSTTTFSFHHVLTGGVLTFPDNTTIERHADYNVVWNFTDKTISIENSGAESAGGTTRKGITYSTNIVSDLVYKASCLSSQVYIPVSGEKTITIGSGSSAIVYDINYGDGTCDNSITVTVGGKTVTITANSTGN